MSETGTPKKPGIEPLLQRKWKTSGNSDGTNFDRSYLKAATGKHVEQTVRLSRMYQDGRNAPRNLVKAAAWFLIARQQSADAAMDSELESRFSPNEIAEAKRQLPELIRELKAIATELQNQAGEN